MTTPDWGTSENASTFVVDFGDEKRIEKTEKNNGAVIIFSKKQHQTRISTSYGTEKVLKDHIAKKIIDNFMIPKFKENKTFEGLLAGTNEVVRFLELPENKIK